MHKEDKSLTINERFYEMRQRLKLTKNAVGEAAGVTGTSIGNIEAGVTKNPNADVLAAISAKLGVSLDWLLLGEGPMLKSQQLEATGLTSGAATIERATELASNGLLRELVDSQAKTIATQDAALSTKDEVIALLKEELKKFGGSSYAALLELLPQLLPTGASAALVTA